MFSPEDVRMVAPALERYTHDRLLGEVWKRPGLSPRDRSIVTLSVLITRSQTIEMAYYLNLALDNGVKPSEVSEMITHLAFYSGWENAMSAAAVVKDVFAQRGIKAEEPLAASPKLLPLDEAAEAQRASRNEQQFGTVAPGVLQYTTEVLFRDLVRQVPAGGFLVLGAARAQHVERHSRDDRRQPPAEVLDGVRVGAIQPELRLLHGVVRLSLGTEHPVGHSSQVGPVGLESIHQPVVIGHRYLLLSRSVMTLTIQIGPT